MSRVALSLHGGPGRRNMYLHRAAFLLSSCVAARRKMHEARQRIKELELDKQLLQLTRRDVGSCAAEPQQQILSNWERSVFWAQRCDNHHA